MSVYENNGLLTYKNKNGDLFRLFPMTKLECIRDIEYVLNHINGVGNMHNATAEQIGAVPASRNINGKTLSSDIVITNEDLGAQPKHIAKKVTLAKSGWSSSIQTVYVDGVTEGNTIIASPDPASSNKYTECACLCKSQAIGELTFSCGETPDSDLVVNLIILN